MRDKAERLARTAERWERGPAGERATAALLARLPTSEWTVFHDLRWLGRSLANVDHIAVGPPGVFVIDSKNWAGSITVDRGVVRQNGRLRGPAVAATGDAARAVARVTTSTSPTHVHRVLCFVRDEDLTGRADDVLLCSTSTLLMLLQTRPPVLTEATRRRVCRDIDAYMRPATRTRSHPRPTPRPVRPSLDTLGLVGRGVAALASFVVGIVALAMLLTSGIPAQFGDLLTSVFTSETGSHDSPATDRSGTKKDRSAGSRDPKPRSLPAGVRARSVAALRPFRGLDFARPPEGLDRRSLLRRSGYSTGGCSATCRCRQLVPTRSGG